MSSTKKKGLPGLLASAVVAAVVMLVVLAGLSAVFYPKDNREDCGAYEQRALGILGEPDDSIDVIVIGDSEAYSAFSPLQMWGAQGFTSYVCATHAQEMCYGNTILHRATQDQHPKVVVIETNTLFRRFSISAAMMRCMEDAVPILEYHDRWKSLTPDDLTLDYKTTYTDLTKGFIVRRGVEAAANVDYMDADAMGEQDSLPRIPRLNLLYLHSMLDYCREIGAEPVFVSMPSTVNWNPARHDVVQSLADETGVRYIDLNVGETRVDVDWENDTRDAGDHMNLSGAKKVSAYLGSWLAEEFDLPDHRGDEDYASWDELLEWYEGKVGPVTQ